MLKFHIFYILTCEELVRIRLTCEELVRFFSNVKNVKKETIIRDSQVLSQKF